MQYIIVGKIKATLISTPDQEILIYSSNDSNFWLYMVDKTSTSPICKTGSVQVNLAIKFKGRTTFPYGTKCCICINFNFKSTWQNQNNISHKDLCILNFFFLFIHLHLVSFTFLNQYTSIYVHILPHLFFSIFVFLLFRWVALPTYFSK